MTIIAFPDNSPPGPRCIKLNINGNLDFNGNYHRILDADWLWCLVAMIVTNESKVIINGKFYATGPRTILHRTGICPDDEWFYWLVVVLVGSCPSGE